MLIYEHKKLNNICQYCNNEIYSTISGFKNHEAMCIKNPNRRIMDYSACKTEEFRRKVSERMKEIQRLSETDYFVECSFDTIFSELEKLET